MTTTAMIFGMMPLALGLGEGSEGNATMGRAIIGGVISSTLLTLVVVPVVYTYLDGMPRGSGRDARAARPSWNSLPQPIEVESTARLEAKFVIMTGGQLATVRKIQQTR